MDFAEVFFQLSDCVLFSTSVGLHSVRVFPFFPFLYAPTEPASRTGGVWTKLLHPFHSFLVSSFCRPALSPVKLFHFKNSPHDASVFSSLLAAVYPTIFLYLCASQLFSLSLSLSLSLFVVVDKTPSYLPFISYGHFSLSSCLMSFCSVLFRAL